MGYLPIHEQHQLKLLEKTGKPKNRILGFLETKDDNQNMGWDCAHKKMTAKGTQISSST
jgi:hypothetical protein